MTSKPQNIQQEFDSFLSKMWNTRGARFVAHERLKARHRMSVFSTSMLSIYLIGLSSITLIGNENIHPDIYKMIPLLVLSLSVFVLVITLIEGSRNYLLNAEKMHSSGMEISEIYGELELALKSKKADYRLRKKLWADYNKILSKYPNHEERQFCIFKAKNYTEPNFIFAGCENVLAKLLISKALLLDARLLDIRIDDI